MARERSPNRDKAHELWKQGGGKMLLKDIAAQLGVSDTQVRKWKNQDNWDKSQKVTLPKNKSNVTNPKGNVTNEPEPEPFPGQCVAVGHKSGLRCRHKALPGTENCQFHTDGWEGQCTAKSKQTGERCKKKAEPGKKVCRIHGGLSPGAPAGNQHNLQHGFFAKIFPDDEETRTLVGEIMGKDPLDILWENIIIQYAAIARAQKIMFVRDQNDMTKVLKREKRSNGLHSDGREEEYELQYAWDKQASFLKAQSQAMQTLERLIGKYEDLVEKYELKGMVVEAHRLKLDKLRSEIKKIESTSGPGNGDGWADLTADGDDDDDAEEH